MRFIFSPTPDPRGLASCCVRRQFMASRDRAGHSNGHGTASLVRTLGVTGSCHMPFQLYLQLSCARCFIGVRSINILSSCKSARLNTRSTCVKCTAGYQQRHPEWTSNPRLDCYDLMEKTFGQRLPTLLEMIQANPRAACFPSAKWYPSGTFQCVVRDGEPGLCAG
jgi:hypothetical protein